MMVWFKRSMLIFFVALLMKNLVEGKYVQFNIAFWIIQSVEDKRVLFLLYSDDKFDRRQMYYFIFIPLVIRYREKQVPFFYYSKGRFGRYTHVSFYYYFNDRIEGGKHVLFAIVFMMVEFIVHVWYFTYHKHET